MPNIIYRGMHVDITYDVLQASIRFPLLPLVDCLDGDGLVGFTNSSFIVSIFSHLGCRFDTT